MDTSPKFDQYIIAIDYDDVIVDQDYPNVGKIKPDAMEVINKWYKQGAYIIIWTCRSGRALLEAELYLLQNSVNFHKINQHHPNGLLHYGSEARIDQQLETRKVWSHILLDDTCILWKLRPTPPTWFELDDMMQQVFINLGPDNKYGMYPEFTNWYE